jgi:hypothetical protein
MGHRQHLAQVVMLVGLLATTSACASSGGYRSPTPASRVDARAYRNGYDAGSIDGANDARRGRRFEIDRNRVYRAADRGYDGYENRGYYQETFRDGYAAGYNDGYRRNDQRSDRRGYPAYGSGGVYRSPAGDNGYRDGYAQGRDDRRDGDRYDPIRASRYREGDHNYNSRYGSRDDYRQEYRRAFQDGYRRGYDEGRS